jgi:phytoene desaturase
MKPLFKQDIATENIFSLVQGLKETDLRSTPAGLLPEGSGLSTLLGLRIGGPVDDLLREVLLDPVEDLTCRPGKKIRGKLVRLGYQLARDLSPVYKAARPDWGRCAEVIELLHAGSLVVDDIQDGSQIRRGQPSLHVRYGLPVALNAGNWLYFWPLQILKEMELTEEQELSLYRYYHQTLLRAHFGQALDVGLRIDSVGQKRVPGVCLSSMELKTGALIAFSLVMGAVLGGASQALINRLEEFGQGFGVALQMFDDLGNLGGRTDPSKRYEDLALGRPSWVWAHAARNYPPESYEQFVSAVLKLPEAESLLDWLRRNDFPRQAKREAHKHLERRPESVGGEDIKRLWRNSMNWVRGYAMPTTRPRAAVIGSGFGGLSAAIRLQAAGLETVIFEKRDLAGGRAYVYRDQGFTFDAGPTVITAPDCLRELFALSGKSMEDYVTLMPVMPFYRLFWEDGFRFDYSNDAGSVFDQIAQKSPADSEGYQEFLKYSDDVFKEGYEKLAHVPFLNWWTMLLVSPQLVRLKAYRSVYRTVSDYIKDPHLRQAFSFHSLLVGGNPFTASSIYTLIHSLERKWGVFFPKGGTGALIQGLVSLFKDLGGEIRLNSEVQEITTRNGKATGIRSRVGGREAFDLIVSNADVVHTYEKLLGKEPRTASMAKRLKKMKHSMSLFLIYFGTRRRYANLTHHNVIFGPRYRGLLKDIFDKGRLADDFSLYLHAPSYSDPSLAPSGCEAFYVLSPVPHLGKLPINWKVEGPRYAEKILAYLEKHYMPGLRSELVTQRIFTPADFRDDLNSYLG